MGSASSGSQIHEGCLLPYTSSKYGAECQIHRPSRALGQSEPTPVFKPTPAAASPTPKKRRRILTAVVAVVAILDLVALLAAPRKALSSAGLPADNPFVCGDRKNEAGYIQVANKKDGHCFYWFFESKSDERNKDPLVIWLTGEPGRSSMIARISATSTRSSFDNREVVLTGESYGGWADLIRDRRLW